MRYRFLDDVLSTDPGPPETLTVTKTFPPGDDAFSGPMGPHAVPNALVLELLAMTGGELIFRHLDGARVPLLLKVQDLEFEGRAGAGEPLRARVELRGTASVSDRVATAETVGDVHGRDGRIARGRFLYVCVPMSVLDHPPSKVER